jgi:hypothetical protein
MSSEALYMLGFLIFLLDYYHYEILFAGIIVVSAIILLVIFLVSRKAFK